MTEGTGTVRVKLMSDIMPDAMDALLMKFGLTIVRVPPGEEIRGSFWGEPEAGIAGMTVYARPDTPVHSVLHEACHVICMTPERRRAHEGDAGSDDIEESAVCYLQIVLADLLPDVGEASAFRDMDAWGYSFRLGRTRDWFEMDADDARVWLQLHALLRENEQPTFRLRTRIC